MLLREAELKREKLQERSRDATLRRNESLEQLEAARQQVRDVRSSLALKQSESLASLKQRQEEHASDVFERIEDREVRRAQSAQRKTERNEFKEEKERLRQSGAQESYRAILTAERFNGEVLRKKFREQDEREAARQAERTALIEAQRLASRKKSYARQGVISMSYTSWQPSLRAGLWAPADYRKD